MQLREKESGHGTLSPTKAVDSEIKAAKEPAENSRKPVELAPTWQAECELCLGPSKAIAVLKATASDASERSSETDLTVS